MSAFTPLLAELPLDGLEAFRLASFGIAYVPQYAPVVMDTHAAANGGFFFHTRRDWGGLALYGSYGVRP